jgi:phosphoglucosamine mutase
MIRGLVRGGCTVINLGIVPTAAVSCFAQSHDRIEAGIMLTASHNSWPDNGIKILQSDGEKLIDTSALSQCFEQPVNRSGGSVTPSDDPLGPWCNSLPKVDLSGRKILFDAAHGAAFEAGKTVLTSAGADVIAVASDPTGRNINDRVGAMHPPSDLEGCDLGICLDGDGDRLVLIDPVHGVLDGDDLLWILAGHYAGPIVGTVMANGGLETALGGRLLRTGVGDAKVHAEMKRVGALVGGEPSGHIMIARGMPTSDGMYTAMRILETSGNKPLPIDGWERLPQENRNVKNAVIDPDLPAIREAEKCGHRVLVRASGTEPLIRIMVEGIDATLWVDRIAETLPRATD